jgi:phospholipid/cholesterol/gamma-HCH transport system substrate-binding protein
VTHIGRRRLHYAAFAAFATTSVAIFAVFYSIAGGPIPFAGHGYTVTVMLDEPLQLVPNSDVRRAGVTIGRVTGIADRGALTAATIELNHGQGPIYADATVQPRFRSPLGETFLELDPGTPRAAKIPVDGELPARRTTETVPIDRVLGTLDARTRAHVRRMLRSAGAGFGGRGDDVNQTLGAIPGLVDESTSMFEILDRQRDQLAGLVNDTGAVLGAIATRRSQVRTLIAAADATARAVASRDAELGRTIHELPSALRQATSSTVALGQLARRGTPVVADLRTASRALGPAVRDLGPAAGDGRRLLRDVRPALVAADPAIKRLRAFAGAAVPAVRRFGPLLDQFEPFVSYLTPFARDFGALFGTQSGAWANDSGCKPTPRTKSQCDWEYGQVVGVVGANSLANYTPEMRQTLDALLKTGVVEQGTGATVRSNPYPEPATIGTPRDDRYYKVVKPRAPGR